MFDESSHLRKTKYVSIVISKQKIQAQDLHAMEQNVRRKASNFLSIFFSSLL